MHVLICGATGQVGQSLMFSAPADWQVSAPSSATLNITDEHCITQIVDGIKPDLIINAAAYTAVDKAETDSATAYKVNQLGCRYLAQAAQQLNCPIFHISTDYVFSGDSTGHYKETDLTHPQSVYGSSKLAGEQEIQTIAAQHIILRTSWVFSAYGTNFVKTMLRLATQHPTLNIIQDQVGAPTSALGIAKTLWALALHYHNKQHLTWGIYHFSGTPHCSWFDFANIIFQQASKLGLITTLPHVNPITTEQYPTAAKRPKNSQLDCTKIFNQFSIAADNWQAQLQTALIQLQAEKKR